MQPPAPEDVSVTCPSTIPKGQDVVISWQTYNTEILGFQISIGTTSGLSDLFTGQFGKNVRAVSLPDLPSDITTLYIEFSYTVPYAPSLEDAKIQGLHDNSEIRLLWEEPLQVTRA